MAGAVVHQPEAALQAARGAYARASAERRFSTVLGLAAFAFAIGLSAWAGEVDLKKFASNIHRLPDYLSRLAFLDDGRFVLSDPAEWFWGLKPWARKLGDSVLMAYLGTLIGAIVGFFACFLASGNLVASPVTVFVVRRGLEFLRAVPPLVFALIGVIAFGLGPLPGVMAMALHSAGALGKQFMEIVENIDMGPPTGVTASGGGFWSMVRYGVLPQVSGPLAGYALLRFEINLRESAVMGFVGAGGIGEDLLEAIRKFYYADVSAILVMIVAAVMLCDALTQALRKRIAGEEGQP